MCHKRESCLILLLTLFVLGTALPTNAANFDFMQFPGLDGLRRKEIVTTADIDLLPNVVYAINGAPAGNNQTVDVGGTSVFFESIVDSLNVSNTIADFAAGNFYNRDTGDAGLNAVINSQAFNGDVPTVTLNNLTIGQNYRVQVIGAGDTRNFDEMNPTPIRFHDVGSADGGAVSFIDRMGDPDGDGMWHAVTGIADFTADATTQTLAFGTDLSAQGTAFSGIVVSSDAPGTVSGLPALSIDRGTGEITLSNNHPTGSFEFTDVTLTSAAGSINMGSNTGSILAPGASVTLAETWEQTPIQDVIFDLTVAGESPRTFTVQYAGAAIATGDLNGDGAIDVTDWTQFKNGSNTDLSSVSEVVAYQNGDLNRDLVQNLEDFQIFQLAFDAANGVGAFAALQSVPEPSTMALAALCLVGLAGSRRKVSRKAISGVAMATAFALLSFTPAELSADVIDWRESVNMYPGSTVETFVDTTGVLAVGYNASGDTSGDANVIVNGQAFTQTLTGTPLVSGTGTESITLNGGTDNVGSFGDGEFTSNAAIFHLIRGATFGVSSVTLDNLQIGQTYSLQVFNNDARGNRTSNFITGYGDGTGSVAPIAFSDLNNSPVNGDAPTFPQSDVGDSIIGTFTPALSSTLTFNIFGSNTGIDGTFTQGDGRAQINAIQLRRIDAIPDPLELIVNRATGEMTIANNNPSLEVGFDAYEITSAGDSLDADNWSSIAGGAGAGLGFPQGDGSGNGWEESPNADSGGLIEWHLLSDGGGSGPVGNADFDADGDIDGGDFRTWQQNVGFTGPFDLQPFGDANGDAAIDGADLAIWQGQYAGEAAGPVTPPLGAGQSISLGNAYDDAVDAQDLVFSYQGLDGIIVEGNVTYVSAATAAVPEPSSASLALVFGIAAFCKSRRSKVLRG